MNPNPEPWLRGTLTDIPAVPRAVLHPLKLAQEDLEQWCGGLTEAELFARPLGLAPLAFHIRHIARSLDRLLTYAEGRPLSDQQLAALHTELDAPASRDQVFAELSSAWSRSAGRIRAIEAQTLEAPRTIGKQALPSTVGGLLVHIADHTQRHVGQAVITAKVLLAQRRA